MSNSEDHPVWDVYNELRTARLNVCYYQSRVNTLRRYNFYIELVLALSVSSGVTGLWLWETAAGGIIWKTLATIAAFAAVVKPIIKLAGQIDALNNTLINWRLLDSELCKLVITIKQYKKYDKGMRTTFFTLLETKKSIVKNETTSKIDEKLRHKCFEKVRAELPADNFFVPEG